MALLLAKVILGNRHLVKSLPLTLRVISSVKRSVLIPIYQSGSFQLTELCYELYRGGSRLQFSTSIHPEKLSWECSTSTVLLKKIGASLQEHQLGESWEAFNDFKRLYGFPDKSLISRLIIELSYSSDPRWLQKASDLVFLMQKEKLDLLNSDLLTKLSLSLARAQMPIRSSMILRLLLEKDIFPPLNILCLIVLHMVKTEIGTNLASNVIIEICDFFSHFGAKGKSSAKLMKLKPDKLIFDLLLDACLRFKSSFKAQQIIELMARMGVLADAHTIVLVAQIHEINGHLDEIKKFKEHIDRASLYLLSHYSQFYDCLLSLHLKFNDTDSATELILDVCKRQMQKSNPIRNDKTIFRPCFVPIGSQNIRTELKLQIAPDLLQKDMVLKSQRKKELFVFRNGKLFLSTRGMAKLISACKRNRKISVLSNFFVSVEKELKLGLENSLSSEAIDSCIYLGWLQTAHDIVDDMEYAAIAVNPASYMLLLTAYHGRKMLKEAKALIKQIKKAGLFTNLSDEMIVSLGSSEVENASTLMTDLLIQEVRDEEKGIPPLVYEFNSSIYFFCKAKMIEDALKAYRKMERLKIPATAQTFAYLVNGFSDLKMYREITILWGDIKRYMGSGDLVINRDLCEFLLLSFLQGGYFERVMEVVDHMKEKGMYADKWMYKSVFLKCHKNLYRNLKAENTKTEAQSKRLEFVQAVRKWFESD